MPETWVVNASLVITLAKAGHLGLITALTSEVLVPDGGYLIPCRVQFPEAGFANVQRPLPSDTPQLAAGSFILGQTPAAFCRRWRHG